MTAAALVSDRPRIEGSQSSFGSFDAQGPRLVLVGGWGPLFELLSGQRRLESGNVLVAGVHAASAVRSGQVGLMLADAPLPPAWTLSDALLESACLMGHASRAGRRIALDHAEALGITALLPRVVSRLAVHERRAAAVAAASLGDPLLLALERPFAGLEPSTRGYVRAVIERASRGRASLISVDAVSEDVAEDELVRAADEILFLGASGLIARGRHADLIAAARTYRVIVLRQAERLLERLVSAGYEARAVAAVPAGALVVSDPAGLGTTPLLRAALEVDAPLVELSPLLGPG